MISNYDNYIKFNPPNWEFLFQGDYRIKQCTVKNQDDFITVHHEMGHIQYYQQYAHQPVVFRSGANPGFHEVMIELKQPVLFA